jgi:PiT family inorganic phosphate transporter
MILFFLSSGLLLGWSLGANDAANVFGTAVATRMVRFRTAAIISSIFVVLGAVISGAGPSHTLGTLGSVNALGGAFTVALSAALTVYWMSKLGLPVSTSQAIVGAIVGWNFFTGTLTDYQSLIQIVSTWVLCPILAAAFAIILYFLFRWGLRVVKIRLFQMDALTRAGLILVGAFGAYALGANNIANVMGVFVPASPFRSVTIGGAIQFSGAQQLFLLGSLAIAVGIFTYSYRVMNTVGNDLMKLTPVAALVVVLSHAIVLFLFSSQSLHSWLIRQGLPPTPLVPVSSTQAVIGGVLGIALVKGGRGIRYRVLGSIAAGWVTAPVIAGVVSFIALFFVQNVFEQKVSRSVAFALSPPVCEKLEQEKISLAGLADLEGIKYKTARQFKTALEAREPVTHDALETLLYYAEIDSLHIEPVRLKTLDSEWLNFSQMRAVDSLAGRSFSHKWELHEALVEQTSQWRYLPQNRINDYYNKELQRKLTHVYNIFRVEPGK